VPTLVVAALSARLLAQSARRGGWNVVALDVFGDVDTRAAAQAWHSIGDPAALQLDGQRFLSALEVARTARDCIGWIAGAGFEPRPDLLEAGARLLPLLGNPRAVIDRVRDPRRFFAGLREQHIAHPETRFDAPAATGDWLMKDFSSSGGWHVVPCSAQHQGPANRTTQARAAGVYFQRRSEGQPMSALFGAAADRAHLIGINELLVRAHGARPYVYHGALGPIELPPERGDELTTILAAVVRTFGLRGLASLDFLLDGDSIQVLEINARPSASMALYDADFDAGLMKVHVEACTGKLPGRSTVRRGFEIRGESIVFARRTVRVDRRQAERLLAFGCHDVPQPDSVIPTSAPLCSVSVRGDSPQTVRAALAQQEAAVLAMVQNRNEASYHAS
jgi:predicted ATP-grasp superfamily ATP-dependent carboligase